ncbi:50S ribosomal protein L33 [Fructobacillus americanaquae]|uniref:Large ribosomal subunit protein bL33 n=1 Tax=Fructobacillus americanaquae TaxID=2940302 RepID=A0ABY5C1P9_9LACO|nr:50S ribosomal protein L33 [Fructobacillus americanaquae]USS91533.1 50S ribosomal protein L33 [Fructobacillus americanaquae]
MPSQKASLACEVCGSRNYTVTLAKGRVERLSVKKFCPHCKKHTLHRETK